MSFVRIPSSQYAGPHPRRSARMIAAAGMAVLTVWIAGCVPSEHVTTEAAQNPQATAPALNTPAQQTPAPSSLQSATREQQRVRILIQQVDQAYAQGEQDYRRGRLAEARAAFDRAVDLMLKSGVDIRTNAQLEEEFNRILDQVNGLEMEALKRGNGFTAQEEETPADVAADVTFTVDPNFLAKARADLATTKSDLPLVVNDYVAAFINFFANTKKGHNTLLHSFQRGGRYKAMIQRVMAEEGVPQDLIYLAVAESGFNPRALNAKSGAGGMWQFMPHGNYGLVRNQYVDERFDPEKSTRASARYMKFIYEQLGDWYLTMAGYDWGAGNVQRAVQKTGYADFWELYKRHNLPAETANYVPEILAAIIIANHPTEYGFDEITLDPPVITDTVAINYSIDLRLVSDIVGAPMDEMQALNPSLLRRVTPPDMTFDLHLPAGTAALYEQRVATVPESHRNAWRYRRVKADDTLASIAHEYHVSESDLADANKLQEGADLKNVEALAIPQAPAPVPSARSSRNSSSQPQASSSLTYKVRKGDTLVTIADRYGVSLDQLRHWNKLSGKGVKLDAGRKLRVSEPASSTSSGSGRHHKKGAAASKQEDSESASATKSATGKSATGKASTGKRSKRGKGSAAAKGAESKAGSESESSGKKTRGGKGKHASADKESTPHKAASQGSAEKPGKETRKAKSEPESKQSAHKAAPKRKTSKQK
ncbi:MAG: transglycosylase SLT domain-containing protein [Terracidiphilus sp.]|nr:transglycosylase SLT domain-containing protein [Terracidiphilus sp.]